MSDDTAQYRMFIDRLQREEFRPGALNDIKNMLIYKPAHEATSTIRDGGITKIVQCVNLPNKVEVDLTCDVLKICFEKFEIGEVVKNYTSHIMYLLRHEKNCVRKLALDEVYKAVMADSSLLPVIQYIDVFVAVAQLVCDEDIGIANKAIIVTSHLPIEAYPKVLEEMKIALQYNNCSKCNALEVIVNISTESAERFNLCIDQGYVDFMISELSSDDILYHLNILELLSKLTVSPHGITYLVKQGIFQNITATMCDLKNNPLGGLLVPGYMKFFGCVAHHYPKEIFDKYPALLEFLFDSLESDEPTVLPISLDTLGFIGATTEGKLSLAAAGSRYTQIVERVGEMIKIGPTELKVRALQCFAALISTNRNDAGGSNTVAVDHRVTLMTREWFRSMSRQPPSMNVLYDICKSPFPDIKLAGFSLLDAVSQHTWGQDFVALTAGFIEYLLDRSVDHSKALKEAKYEIIKRLSTSPSFDNTITMRLVTYVEQGPFFSSNELQVAMEDGEN